jgi:hypothetical protein
VHIQSRLNTAAFFSVPDMTNGTPLTLWDRVESVGQDFKFTTVRELRVAGKCLIVPASAGQSIVLGDCSGTANQKWTYVTATGVIRSDSGFCIHIFDEVTTPGVTLILNTCTGEINQQWNLLP